MNVQQLRYLNEIANHSLNISEAAKALHTSQPGVSKQIRLLELELRTDLLVRHRNKIIALTEQGHKILEYARRILVDVENIRRVAADRLSDPNGALTIATTHLHARYILPDAMRDFKEQFGSISLDVKIGNPAQISEWVTAGEADIGITTAIFPRAPKSSLVRFPCFRIHSSMLARTGHELLKKKKLTLADIARFPLILPDSHHAATSQVVMRAFRSHGIDPKIVLTATDSSVIKACVEGGMGITVLPFVAYDATTDRGLRMLTCEHLFDPVVSYIWVHQRSFLPSYAVTFIEMLSPVWTRPRIDRVQSGREVANDELAVRPVQRRSPGRRPRDRVLSA